MSTGYRPVTGHPPWPRGTSAEVPQREALPQQSVSYECARGHVFTLRFADGAEAPGAWEHSCGVMAWRDGEPREPAESSEEGPGAYGDITPMGQLRKRRSKTALEALLAERMTQVRQMGVAR